VIEPSSLFAPKNSEKSWLEHAVTAIIATAAVPKIEILFIKESESLVKVAGSNSATFGLELMFAL
jgi:hypothetical protein